MICWNETSEGIEYLTIFLEYIEAANTTQKTHQKWKKRFNIQLIIYSWANLLFLTPSWWRLKVYEKRKSSQRQDNVNEHTAKKVSPTTKYLDPKQKNFNMATFDKYLHRQENNSN